MCITMPGKFNDKQNVSTGIILFLALYPIYQTRFQLRKEPDNYLVHDLENGNLK